MFKHRFAWIITMSLSSLLCGCGNDWTQAGIHTTGILKAEELFVPGKIDEAEPLYRRRVDKLERRFHGQFQDAYPWLYYDYLIGQDRRGSIHLVRHKNDPAYQAFSKENDAFDSYYHRSDGTEKPGTIGMIVALVKEGDMREQHS